MRVGGLDSWINNVVLLSYAFEYNIREEELLKYWFQWFIVTYKKSASEKLLKAIISVIILLWKMFELRYFRDVS